MVKMPQKKQRVVMSRLVKLKDADRSFDIKFWNRIGTEGKFRAAWEMVCDLPNWGKHHVDQPRLQRSVSALKRRGC